MSEASDLSEPLQSGRFLGLYALAWAGGAAAYIPILTVLLPARIADLAGAEAVTWLAVIAFCGAVAASLANILAGLLSDVLRRRRWPALAGLAGYVLLTPLFAAAQTLTQFLLLIVAWQSALNLMLAPLAAWAADSVPDRQKGLLGGLIAFAPATGAAAGALATIALIDQLETRLFVVIGFVACAVLPLLLFGRPRPIPALDVDHPPSRPPTERGAAARMWLARLLVQIAEATLFAYLYLWLSSVDATYDQGAVARLFLAMLALGIPVSLAAGRWSDRQSQPIRPLRLSAGVAALGLAGMALAQSTTLALIAYALFTLATAVFLSLHSAQVLRVLPKRTRRGRDLGIFNLTNTVPSLVMPALTITLVPALGFAALFWVLALLALTAPFVLPRD